MAMITAKKKPENKGQELVDVVFSWSLGDVLNRNLYKEKVCKRLIIYSLVTICRTQVKLIVCFIDLVALYMVLYILFMHW